MNDLPDSDGEITIRMGSGDSVSLSDIPMNVVQALYHRFTGKTESTGYQKDVPFHVGIADLQILYDRIKQQLSQHDLVGPNIKVKVEYKNNNHQIHSSWEKFIQSLDETKQDPVESININYEFLIKPPGNANFYEQIGVEEVKYNRYNIDITLVSKISLDFGEMFSFLKSRMVFSIPSAVVKIDYINWIVADSLLTNIKAWVDGLSKIENRYHSNRLQSISRHFSFYFDKIGILSCLILSYYMIEYFDIDGQSTFGDFANWLIASLFVIVGAQMIFRFLARSVERYVDKTQELSYIELSRGDRVCFENFQRKNKGYMFKAGGLFLVYIFTIILNVFSNYISQKMF